MLGRRLLLTAQDVMRSDNLPIITPEMKLGEAIILISAGKLGLGVAVSEGRIVGIITDGDVRRATQRHHERFFNVPVSEVMTRDPVCVSPGIKVNEIVKILNERKIHAVLVVGEERNLIGIVDNFRCMI